MQKTKIAAEELAEMIRDGLAEEGHEVHVHPPACEWAQCSIEGVYPGTYKTHLEWFNLAGSGQRIVGVTAHVRSPCRRHNDVDRRYHARRIHRAAKRPIKPASWNLGLQYDHAMRRDRAMKKYLVIYGRPGVLFCGDQGFI